MTDRWEFAIWNEHHCSPKYVYMTFNSQWIGLSDKVSVAHTVLSLKENFDIKQRGKPTDIYISSNALALIDEIDNNVDMAPAHDEEANTLFGMNLRTLEDFRKKYDEIYKCGDSDDNSHRV